MDKSMVTFEDMNHRMYVCNREDYDRLLDEHPDIRGRVCEIVTTHKINNYPDLCVAMMDNEVLDYEEVEE